MNTIKYRLVISDLDGTLVEYGSNHISEAVINSMSLLKEKGIFFTIATGRSWKQTKDIAIKLGVTIPVILQAGAIILDPVTEKVIRQQPLNKKLAKQLMEFTVSAEIEIDRFHLNENGSYFASQVNTAGGNWLLKSGEECCLTNIEEQHQASIIKYLYIGPERSLKLLSEKIYREIKPSPNMILWPPNQKDGDWFLEVFDPLASKGQALRWLAKYLKIKLSQIIAFGDGFNDIDMLQHAGLGVAMENAPLHVTSKARLVIPGPEQDGIARFLNEFYYKGAI